MLLEIATPEQKILAEVIAFCENDTIQKWTLKKCRPNPLPESLELVKISNSGAIALQVGSETILVKSVKVIERFPRPV